METNERSELIKYRKAFIVHALLGVAGIAAGVFFYKFTDMLSGSADGYVYVCRADLRELLVRYFTEARYMILLFAAGFTIFAPPVAIAFAVIRGFVCAVGILRLASACMNGGISALHFTLTACFMAAIFAVELIMAAKSVCHADGMHYVAPKPGELVKSPSVRIYCAVFAMLCGILFAAVTAVYFAPLLPF